MKMEIRLIETNIDKMIFEECLELVIDMEENLLIRSIFYNYGAN